MLWKVLVTFSAIHSSFLSGNQVFISAGASVFGVFWNTIFTPSTVSSSRSSSITRVGAIRVTLPMETFWARPWPAWPKGLAGSRIPYW